MTDTPDTPTERAEQAAARRRWISLAEFVAVAGLLIGAATLYLNWSDRREDSEARSQAIAGERKARSIATLSGTVKPGGDAIAIADPAHSISTAVIRFPDALGTAERDAMPGPRIRAEWFARPLLELTDNGPDAREGRLPVLITTGWWDGDTRRQDTALYDILWRTEGRVLQGRALVLTGLVLRERTDRSAALEAAWTRQGLVPAR